MEVQLPKDKEDSGSLDSGAADPEKHGRAGQERLGLQEPALVLAQRSLEMVDLGQHQRVGDTLTADEIADVPEMLLSLAQIAASPAGVRHLSRGEGEQGEAVRMPRGVMDDGAGKLGEIVPLPRVGGSPASALLDQQLGEDRSPEPAPGSADSGEALRRRDREKLLQVPLGLPPPLLQIG